MKRALAALVVLLAGCSSPNYVQLGGVSESDVRFGMEQFGHACGLNDDQIRDPRKYLTPEQEDLAVACVRSRYQAQRPVAPIPAQNDLLRALSEGFQGAGAILSPDVYNAQRGLAPSAPVMQIDTTCLQRCIAGGLGYGFCQSRCSY